LETAPNVRSADSWTAQPAARYVEAAAAAAIAALLSWVFRGQLAATRLLLFWVASLYVARRSGLGPALFCALIGILLANFTVTHPIGVFTAPTVPETLSSIVYLAGSSLLGITFDRLRRSRAALENTAHQLSLASAQLQDQAV
jgi:two-component system sensor histidine kinase KdpD